MTRSATIKGYVLDTKKDNMKSKAVTVRIVKDCLGETLSLKDESTGQIIEVPVEPISYMIKLIFTDNELKKKVLHNQDLTKQQEETINKIITENII